MKNSAAFTDRAIEGRKLTRGAARELLWDAGQPGLYLLISSASKTYRSRFCLRGRWITRKRATVGEHVVQDGEAIPVDVHWAKTQAKKDRALALAGTDPRQAKPVLAAKAMTFAAVVDRFIENYAKPRQRSWRQTEAVLKSNCAAWLEKPFAEITKQDAKSLLRSFLADGHGPKMRLTHAWLKTLWKWAVEDEEIVPTNVMLFSLPYQKNVRDRVWSDDEIRNIWRAADQLGPIEGNFVKLILLLAPRKNALAKMHWSELDDRDHPTMWITPFERTKSRKLAKPRTYLTPLPALASRIFKSIPRRHVNFVFLRERHAGATIATGTLMQRLIRLGAPDDFNFHCARHSIASHFKEASDFEVGLLLNHSASNVTSGYRHGSTGLKMKADMLSEWSEHIAALVQPSADVALLR